MNKLQIKIDGNVFEYDFKKTELYINKVHASEKEELNFFETIREATESDSDFNESVFYENYNIVNLDDINYKLNNINIIESSRGCMSVKTVWGRDTAFELKSVLDTAYRGGEPISFRESLDAWCEHHIDRNYVIMTKKQLINFIKERNDHNLFWHSSLVNYVNNKL